MLDQLQNYIDRESRADVRVECISASGLVKYVDAGSRREAILKEINLDVPRGGLTAIVGPSGAGKTSLLYCLSGLDRPDSGSVIIDGVDVYALSEEQRSRFIRGHVGFVFQQYNLVPYLTVAENVTLPLVLNHRKPDAGQVRHVLTRFGLESRAGTVVSMLSGGEQQRAALCRALLLRASIVFADEPTGALDTVNSEVVLGVLRELADGGASVVMVTHDMDAAALADRVVLMQDGSITRMTGRLSAERISAGMRRSLDPDMLVAPVGSGSVDSGRMR